MTSSELYFVNELKVRDDVTNLDCHRAKITNINIPTMNQLLKLVCFQNLMKLLPPLTNKCSYINANQNRINSLDKIPTDMIYLNLCRNRLQTINFYNFSDSLQYLNIAHNFINKIPILPKNLKVFIACDNKFKSLPELPANLEVFKCCKNYLTELPEILPPSLEIIACKNNDIKYLPDSLLKCHELYDLKYDNNKSIRIKEEILEYIDEIFARRQYRTQKTNELKYGPTNLAQTVYSSGQNVHDETISKNILESIKNILNTKLILKTTELCLKDFYSITQDDEFEIKEDKDNIYGTPMEKLEYLCNLKHKHSVIDMTFAELFVYVWNRIRLSPYGIDIVKVLLSELDGMMSVCFSGRISRLINCLSGYDDGVNIGISENSQIQAKYNLIAKDLNQLYDADTIEYNIIFRYRFCDLLKEINVKEETIAIWLEPFDENIKDYLSENILNKKMIKKFRSNIEPSYLVRFIKDNNNDINKLPTLIQKAMNISFNNIDSLKDTIMYKYQYNIMLIEYSIEQAIIDHLMAPCNNYIIEYLKNNRITEDNMGKLRILFDMHNKKEYLKQFVDDYFEFDHYYQDYISIVVN